MPVMAEIVGNSAIMINVDVNSFFVWSGSSARFTLLNNALQSFK